MNNILKGRFTTLFWWYFVTYLIVLIIPMSAVLYAYKKSDEKIKEDMKSTVEQLLRQSRYVIDGNIIALNQMAQQISVDETFLGVLSNNEYSLYNYWNMQKKLRFYKSSSDMIYKVNIILKNEVVISDDIVTDRLDFYYDNNVLIENKPYAEWYKSLFETYYYDRYFPACNSYMNGKNERVIIFLKTLPIDDTYNPSAVLMIMLRESKLAESLGNFKTEGGWAYILDREDNIIASADGKNSLPEGSAVDARSNSTVLTEGAIYISLLSENNNWLYIAAYPSVDLMNKNKYALATLIYFLLFTFLSGIIVSAFFSKKQTNQINRLAKAVVPEVRVNNQRNIFMFLNDSIHQLVQNKNILQQRVDAELPYIKAAYLEKLLKGEFVSNEELTASFAGIETNINFSYYFVALIQINGFYGSYKRDEIARFNLQKESIANFAVNFQEGPAEVHSVNDNRIALIFWQDDCSRLKEAVERLARELTEFSAQYDIRLSFGAGNVYGTANDIFLSYREAAETLDYKPHDSRRLVVFYNELPKQNDFYFYPLEFEIRLINLTRTGSTEEVESTLDKLFEENFQNRTLSKEQCKYLLDEINGTFHKIFFLQKEENEMILHIHQRLELLREQRTMGEVCCEIKRLFAMACTLGRDSRHRRSDSVYRQVEEIIWEEYTNPQLSLRLVADRMHMNDNYFSRLFKELFGMSFSDYVENIRMSKAQTLLNETEMPISEVACNVGYASVYVFRRAFKRVYGILPKQSRE